jgi:hypothetical protein
VRATQRRRDGNHDGNVRRRGRARLNCREHLTGRVGWTSPGPPQLESERPARDRGFESPRFRGSAVVRPSRVIVIGLVDNSG